MRRATKKLGEEARLESSRIAGLAATEDKGAIIAAMTKGRGPAGPSAPPDFNRISDAQFRETVKKEYGFTPGV